MSIPLPCAKQEDSRSADELCTTSRGVIVGRSQALRNLLTMVGRIARATCTVLITGETGTGKEALAAAVHDASPRKDQPLITVNCGALPAQLADAQIFGHARGAFTGAHTSRPGFVGAAEGGTLFLDEIGELPLELQVKLLRLLQQNEYRPVGGNQTIQANVRIIAATHRDLREEVAAGRFREDLYYRLDVVSLEVPALRERPEDIEPLAQHFLTKAGMKMGKMAATGISDGAMAALEGHDWPGNVRELENAIMRSALLFTGDSCINVCDLPLGADPSSGPAAALPDAGLNLRAEIEEYERSLISQALDRTKGNKSKAAQLLGLNRTTLVEMVKRRKIA
jgi:transcriptional regulator with PAS, ATPase and Fis domain